MKAKLAQALWLSSSLACVLPPPSAPPMSVDSTLEASSAAESGSETSPPPEQEPVESAAPAPLEDRTMRPGHPINASAHPDAVIFQRGEEELALWIPRDEELTYRVVLELGLLGDIDAGQVVLSSGVERYVSGLPSRGQKGSKNGELETGWIRSHATGSYAGYRLDHELRTRLLPQTWPHVYYTDTQSGSENRRRELKLGVQDSEFKASYRADGHCKGCDNPEHFIKSKWTWGKPYHCPKCKLAIHRVWKEPVTRPIPRGTVDMLSAVYLARSLIRDGRASTDFLLIDKQQLWQVHLARGKRQRVETPAGRFDAQEVRLSTSVPSGESRTSDGFEGMFGIRGTIQIWLEAESGVPVLIQGELPVPVLGSLDVRVELKSSRGTPGEFTTSR